MARERGRFRVIDPEFLRPGVPLQQLRHESAKGQRVGDPPGEEVLERLVDGGQGPWGEIPSFSDVVRDSAGSSELEATVKLQTEHLGSIEFAHQSCPRLVLCSVPAESGDQAPNADVVEGLVDRDLSHVVPHQLAAELADPAVLLADPNANVVDVDLVLDCDQVDRAECVVEPEEGPIEFLDGLVEGAIVG